MKRLKLFLLASLSVLLASSLARAHEAGASSPDTKCRPHPSPRPLQPQTVLQLEAARRAAAKYFDVKAATDDGYMDLKLFIPHMGWHFLNMKRLNGHFDPERPELLVYQEDCDGSLRLAAVEYAIPLDLSAKAPHGFVGDDDVWFRDEGFQLWTLHAWVYDYNPDGVFAPDNPRLP